MKRTFLCAAALALLISGCSNISGSSQSGADSIAAEEIPVIEPMYRVEEKFYDNGELTSHVIRYKDEYFNDLSSQIRDLAAGEWGALTEEYSYVYDRKGRMTVRFDLSSEGSFERFYYDGSGREIRREQYSGGEMTSAVITERDVHGGELCSYTVTGSTTDEEIAEMKKDHTEREYDENERLIHVSSYKGGELISELFFEYDDGGKLVCFKNHPYYLDKEQYLLTRYETKDDESIENHFIVDKNGVETLDHTETQEYNEYRMLSRRTVIKDGVVMSLETYEYEKLRG